MNVQSTFLFLADLLLKGAVLLPLLLLAERSLRRSPPAARSALLLCGIAALALLPITRLVPPYWTWAAAPTLTAPTVPSAALPVVKVTGQQTFQFDSLSSSPRASTSWPDWRLVSSCLWAIGVFAHLARIAHGRWQLRRLFSASRRVSPGILRDCFERLAPVDHRNTIDLRLSAECPVPVTWGVWRSTILLPAEAADWPLERMEIVLRHELAHIARRDAAARLLAQFVCTLHWCNPLAWMATSKLRLAQEQSCDELVLAGGSDPAAYAEELVQSVRRLVVDSGSWSAALAMAQPSTLQVRVAAVLERRDRRGTWVSRVILILSPAVALLTLVGVSLAQIGGAEKPAGDPSAGSAAPAQQQGAIEFAARFLEIPVGETPPVLAKIMADSGSKGYGILPAGAEENLPYTLGGMPHVNLLSAPRVMAKPGQTGVVEITEKVPIQTESGAEKLVDAGIRCSMSGIFQRDEKGQEEVQLTIDASIYRLRPGSVPPHTEKSFEKAELKQTVLSIAPGACAVFRTAGPDARNTTWVVISARRSKLAAESATPPPANASLTLSLPVNTTKIEIPGSQAATITPDPFASPKPETSAPRASLNLTPSTSSATKLVGTSAFTATITAPQTKTELSLEAPNPTISDATPAQKEAAAAAEFAASPIEINAEETRFEQGVAVATGNATLKHKEVVIHGDQIRYDPKSRTAHATGNVTATSGPNKTETQDLEYQLVTDEMKTTGPTKTTLKASEAPASSRR